MNIYTIRDQVAGFFMPPFCAENDNLAVRMWTVSMGDNFVHRADFSLHRLGSFDTDSGVLTASDPTLVRSGTSIPIEHDPRPATFNMERSA